MTLLHHTLTYHTDSARLFARILHRQWATFLDSGQMVNPATGKPGSQYGRYDILVADPFLTFSTQGALTTVSTHDETHVSLEDPFLLIKQALAAYEVNVCDTKSYDLPFTGGAVGYFGYDLARRLEKLGSHAIATQTLSDKEVPQLQVGIYDWAVVIDHRNKTACLVSHGIDMKTREQWSELCALFDTPDEAHQAVPLDFEVTTAVRSNMDKKSYQAAFEAIQTYIQEGDCYQVNLAQRFSAKVQGDGWVAYQKLREISPAPFMAFMNLEGMQVISGSPERFLQVVDGHVETRPIKGTRPRADDPEVDRQYAEALQASLKDKAENLMIVDLLRNDISKNCKIGSVKAEKLFQLQSFANVHHLVSIVTGILDNTKTAVDLLRGCFPGGSITGAPKLRAMQIIEALEPHRRGVYCGAIGYIGFDGNMDTNVAIRTAVYVANENAEGEISFYAGGGIVADSTFEKEYAETLDKVSSMLKVMQCFSTTIKE